MNKRIYVLWCAITIGSCAPSLAAKKLLLIDADQRSAYSFDPFIAIARSVGFETTYISIAELLDDPQINSRIDQADSVFFLLSIPLLKKLPTQSPVVTAFMKAFGHAAQQPQKVIGLVLPQVAMQAGYLNPFFKRLGFEVQGDILKTSTPEAASIYRQDEIEQHLTQFIQLSSAFLAEPHQGRTSNRFPIIRASYNTTLIPRAEGRAIMPPIILGAKQMDISLLSPFTAKPRETVTPVTLLPMRDPLPEGSFHIRNILPHGVYWFNPLHNNHVAIISDFALAPASLHENMHFTPDSSALIIELHKTLQEVMHELAIALESKDGMSIERVNKKQRPALPPTATNFGNPLPGRKKIKCAWMQIEACAPNPEAQYGDADKLIDNIFASDTTHLWLSIKPNTIYSPIGQIKNRERLLETIKNFTQKLQAAAQNYEAALPQILIGFELNWNLYAPNLPQDFAVDLYGNQYDDMPAPLNEQFWHNEVATSFALLMADWNNPEISNGVPVSGIVLDLEFYTRRKGASAFTATMGFSPATLERVTGKPAEPINDAVDALIATHGVQKYFSKLYEHATSLGKQLRQEIIKQIPSATIGCYVPTVDPTWFHRGFFRGLSSREHPLLLLSFNTEFARHKKWLEENKIFVKHLGVLMLSRLTGLNSFGIVDGILDRHDGIWLNRFSRFSEPYTKDETLERSKMSPEEIAQFMDYLKSK